MHHAHGCGAQCIRVHRAPYIEINTGDKKMKDSKILAIIEEITKYIDLCYWKKRRKNPDSAELKNWAARKRKSFQKLWFGEEIDH